MIFQQEEITVSGTEINIESAVGGAILVSRSSGGEVRYNTQGELFTVECVPDEGYVCETLQLSGDVTAVATETGCQFTGNGKGVILTASFTQQSSPESQTSPTENPDQSTTAEKEEQNAESQPISFNQVKDDFVSWYKQQTTMKQCLIAVGGVGTLYCALKGFRNL